MNMVPYCSSPLKGAGRSLPNRSEISCQDARKRCTASAVSAGMNSSSLASDRPPGLVARNRISSCLKVVGLSTTRTPLDSVHSVSPAMSRLEVFATAPAAGRRASNGLLDVVSTYAVRAAALAELITPASVTSLGSDALSLSGAEIATRRVRSGIQFLATAFTSASEISGRKRWFKPYS